MKKILAILLSALMLCAMIPFATVAVAADEDHYIELVADAEEVDAGDYVTIEVSMYGHESVGLIAALIELGFDHDVFELETYYDEDEEMWMPPIEVGSKFNATSNKYITFGPIDEDTGYMEYCLVNFVRGTATANQAVKTNLFYTVTFKVKDDAVSGDYTINVADIEYTNKNTTLHGGVKAEWSCEPITIHVNGAEPEEPSCEHEYNYDCDKNCSKCGEETRPEADHAYFYPCDAYCMYCYELTNEGAAHNETHVEAVEATCQVNGNIEYWYCADCGTAWDANGMPVNRFTVITFGEHVYTNPCDAHCAVCGELTNEEAEHTIVAVDAKAPTCTEAGNVAYWYCSDCGSAWLDAECTIVTNQMAVKLGATCATGAEYHEGVEAGCHYVGMNEYWYCANCDVFYADAACTIVTNYKSLMIPALQDSAEYVPAKDATCYENGNVEYWVCYECEQVWADAALTQLTNIMNVQIGMGHAEATHVEAKDPTCTELGNIEYWYCAECGAAWLDAECTLNTNMMAVKLGASCKYGAEYTEAKAATCYEPGNTEYWYCANCDVYYADADCTIITNAKNVIIPITHNVIHVEAKEPTCTELGNIEFWYCADCGQAWLDEYCHLNTNMMAVKLAASCKYGAEYVEAKAATCFEPGNTEYWYCANCDVYYADADCTIITNAQNVVLPIAHNVIHVAAKAATCTELGNIEFWYCADCGQAWLDEYCHLNTNMMAVKLPMAEHTYAGDCDTTCDACGAEREVVLPAAPVIFGGNSISENKNGLAFLFTADVDGIIINDNYKADYTNATVIINGEEHKVVGMGAILNNKGYENQTLENVDKNYVLNVKANKVFDGSSYAIRIVNIPAEQLDTTIIARSYISYECGGEIITIYGEDIATSYNAELG